MKKFMVLYMANGAEFEKMMKNSTPEQQKKGMEGWMKWMGDHKASLVVSGQGLVGLVFAPGRSAILATQSAVHHLSWGVQGKALLD